MCCVVRAVCRIEARMTQTVLTLTSLTPSYAYHANLEPLFVVVLLVGSILFVCLCFVKRTNDDDDDDNIGRFDLVTQSGSIDNATTTTTTTKTMRLGWE